MSAVKQRLTLLIAATLLLLSLRPASATIAIVDQQNPGAGFFLSSTVATGQGFGQSFTPSLAAISAADFSLFSGTSSTLRLDIFSGSGFAGSLLGSSAPLVLTGTQTLEFLFGAPVVLVPGNVYTMRITLLSGATYSLENSGDTYAGGNAFSPDGIAGPSVDAAFIEGLAVPEASTWLLFLIGLVPVAGLVRRRRVTESRS